MHVNKCKGKEVQEKENKVGDLDNFFPAHYETATFAISENQISLKFGSGLNNNKSIRTEAFQGNMKRDDDANTPLKLISVS